MLFSSNINYSVGSLNHVNQWTGFCTIVHYVNKTLLITKTC